jgi:hypothetical protein
MPEISQKTTRQILKDFPDFKIAHLRRHFKVTNPTTGDFIIVPATCSDRRGFENMKCALRRLARGHGFLARAKQQREQA